MKKFTVKATAVSNANFKDAKAIFMRNAAGRLTQVKPGNKSSNKKSHITRNAKGELCIDYSDIFKN